MRSYEVMFIMAPNLESEETEAIINKVTKVITDRDGVIQSIDRWGKRKLAYEIAGHRDGNYTVVTFQGPPQVVAELERVLGITDGVIRYLVVKQPPVANTAAAKPSKRGAVKADGPAEAASAGREQDAPVVEVGASVEA